MYVQNVRTLPTMVRDGKRRIGDKIDDLMTMDLDQMDDKTWNQKLAEYFDKIETLEFVEDCMEDKTSPHDNEPMILDKVANG